MPIVLEFLIDSSNATSREKHNEQVKPRNSRDVNTIVLAKTPAIRHLVKRQGLRAAVEAVSTGAVNRKMGSFTGIQF